MMYSQKEQQNWSSSQTLMVLAPASRIVKTKNFGIKSNRPHHSRKEGSVCLRTGALPALCTIYRDILANIVKNQ